MNARVTAAERAALPVARAALESQASAYGMADTIVFALGAAQLLQSPETAANAEHVAKCLVERTEELMAAGARVAELEQQLRTVRDDRDMEIVQWLGTKAREYRSTGGRQHALQADAVEVMASKIARGAVRAAAGVPTGGVV